MQSFLTETQLSDFSSFDNIQSHFQSHMLELNNDAEDKFKSLPVLKKSRINSTMFSEMSCAVLNRKVSIVLLYQNKASNIAQFTEHILYLIRSYKPNLVIGNFNLNALILPNPALVLSIKNLNYHLMIAEPTHI